MSTHALTRTSPKGGPFIGRCFQCGKENLSMADAFEECPNPSGMTREQSLLEAIEPSAASEKEQGS